MKPEIYKSLRPMSHDEVLGKLMSQARSAGEGNGSFPRLQIQVGAQLYEGELLKVEEFKGAQWLALYHRNPENLGADAVTYLPLSAVSALTVGDFSERANFVLSGTMPPIAASDVPSKLEIYRLLTTIETQLQGLGWKEGRLTLNLADRAEDDGFRYRAKRVLEALPGVVEQLLADSEGKRAFASIGEIALVATVGTALKVEKKPGTLSIQIGAEINAQGVSSLLKKLLEESL